MNRSSVIGMDLATIRKMSPDLFSELPLNQDEFVHLINLVNAGQIYRGEPTADVFHFVLNSGLHSACYLNCPLLLAESNLLSIFGQQLIQTCGVGIRDVDWVIGSAMASVALAAEIGRQLQCRAGYVEKGKGRALEHFRFIIPEGERVLVINELMTTGGGTTWDTKRLVQEQNPFPVQFLPLAGVLVSRSKDDSLKDGTPVKHVFRFEDFPTYVVCPFCATGSPLFEGGKKDWAKLLQSRRA